MATDLKGQCLCGQCICHPPGDSRVHGKNCECDNRQCEDISGEVCGGHGYCSCGRCICEEGWFGKRCQFPRSCDMSDAQSKELCETSDGVLCSGKALTIK
ncbi:integrin beta-like protein 1 [Lates japonicus]|uniref:Integrin beta-like protein 1 n=1 Tax=Lates japonicus TaxID=270547 RepID=A0AAD3MDH5_LATJO|nr:integrin beta-like protein 1 [Lates japonicus]